MPAAPIVEANVDPKVASRLITAAAAQLGQPLLVARVGITDRTSTASGSYTALVVGATLAAVAGVRVRAGEWQEITVRSFRRSSVVVVVTGETEAWVILDAPQVEMTRPGGPNVGQVVLTVPVSTVAHEVLIVDAPAG